ncbi:MAG: nuclear transport factor 2 family protein [Solirubrobacterales bacterium]
MTDPASDVTQLILRERQARDRGWYDRMRECYSADSIVDMSWFNGPGHEFVRRSQEMSESRDGWGGHTGHRLSPPAIRIDGDRALGELPLGIEFRITIEDVEADLISYCRNQYRARRDEGTWQIERLTSIYERDTLTPAIPGARLPLEPELFAEFRPSYRCLAWYQRGLGIDLRADLLGDDRPEEVARQYAAEESWLGGDR